MKLWFGVQTVSTLFSWLTVAPSAKNIYNSIFQITCKNIFKCATKYLVYKSALSGVHLQRPPLPTIKAMLWKSQEVKTSPSWATPGFSVKHWAFRTANKPNFVSDSEVYKRGKYISSKTVVLLDQNLIDTQGVLFHPAHWRKADISPSSLQLSVSEKVGLWTFSTTELCSMGS